MQRISPNSMNGPRAYFTSFDNKILSRTDDKEKLRRDVERKLKLLLLIKSRVVCAASHLSSPIAFSIFSENPILLNQRMIIPALRSDKENILHALEGKIPKVREHQIKFYEENIVTTIKWDLEDNSAWFRRAFLAEVADDHSLLRTCMPGVSAATLDSLISSIKSQPLLSREQIETLASPLPAQARMALLNYRELIYHMSGARVVNCESSLPQENYIDYDLADLSQTRTKLSEEYVFWKLFIELVLESFQRRLLSVELLDLLSFEDILSIRSPLLESSFQTAYDELVQGVIADISTKNHQTQLLDLPKLEKIREQLEEAFRNVFEEELKPFLKKRALAEAKEVASVGSSVALGALGFIPVVGSVASGLSVLKDSPALIFNVTELYGSIKAVSSIDTYAASRSKAVKAALEKVDVTEKSTMLDMVDLLTTLLAERVRL